MQKLTSTLSRLAFVVAGALALGSCSRSEYAFLPRSASYLGTTTAAPKVRKVAPAVAVAPAPAAAEMAAPEATAPVAAPVAVAPVASVLAASKAPAAVATKAVATASQSPAAEATTVAAAPAAAPKLNLLQRLALNKVMHKLDKQTQKMTARLGESKSAAARSGIDGKLRYAIIFGAISLIFFVIGGSVGNLIGAILLIIALLFLLFWLLDNL